MYFCNVCKKYFNHKKSPRRKDLWKEYSAGKQTQEQIAQELGKSREWVNRHLKKEGGTQGKNIQINPQRIVVVTDTTYFKQFGLMVFRASNLKANLLWKIVENETNEAYRSGIQELIDNGWKILAIVADGKPGLGKLFPNIPFQKCQFHQFLTVTQCISKNPKLEASQQLREIMFYLKETDHATFKYFLDTWFEIWKDFLREKTINPITGKSSYTHQRLRRAYFSLRRNLNVLFTSEFHSKDIQIPNTTNSLEGYFSHLKSKLSVHRGASRNTQIILISELIFQ